MDTSGEVTDIHMRTDAKNLMTTTRIIHSSEQKETVHMISILRKEACSGSIHDFAHIPTQNRLADCFDEVICEGRQLNHKNKREIVRC